jgi:uncharacterized membrane protein
MSEAKRTPHAQVEPPAEGARDEERDAKLAVERAAARLLRWGTIASIVLVLGGLTMFLVRNADRLGDPDMLAAVRSPDHAFPKSVVEIARGVAALDGMAIILLGVMTLIFTPILRVITSGLAFLRSGDRAFAAFALVVLVLLAIAFAAGGLREMA